MSEWGKRLDAGVERRWITLHRDGQEIGELNIVICTDCRQVLLCNLGVVEAERGKGLALGLVQRQRRDVAGYWWSTTSQNVEAESFWRRLQRMYPGEYHERAQLCHHIDAVT